jgi:glutamate N-acetyltransferase/amino-acid N-acetyltransferase
MIEPNMATMLSYILSDWDVDQDLYSELKFCVDETFNCLSIDSDTSTSDTVVLMASGEAGILPSQIFRKALYEICLDLTKQIAMDGEGATKLIIVKVENAKNETQAIKIGKSILNSPLVKTAIYGGDPNWGRLVMAIGKVFDEPIPYENLQIHFGDLSVKDASTEQKILLSKYLKENTEINLKVNLGMGTSKKEFYGCDFTEGYIKENAYYTT